VWKGHGAKSPWPHPIVEERPCSDLAAFAQCP
jgi:hypothetical protein